MGAGAKPDPGQGRASVPAWSSRAGRLAVLGAGTAAAVWLLLAAGSVLLPFAFALILAYLLEPPVAVLAGRGLHRGLATAAVYGLAGAVLALALFYLFPVLARESSRLAGLLPVYVARAESWWDGALVALHQAPLPPGLHRAALRGAAGLERRLAASLGRLAWGAVGLLPALASLLVSPVLAFYLLKDADRIRGRFWALVPSTWHAAVYKLGLDLDRTLSGFVRGQILVAAAVGLLALLWLWILGIPFAPLIALVAAATDIIPYLGPVAGALPAVLLALAVSPWRALWAALGFIAIHQLEGAVVGPLVMGEAVGLHPLVVILALLVGAEVGGVMGVFLSVPLAAALKVVLEHLYRRLAG